MSKPLLIFTPKGIYCSAGDFYIDPWEPVNQAVITHAHSDHARVGSKKYLCHADSMAIIQHRLGSVNVSGISYNEPVNINGVKVSLHPAGHIVGSAQVRVEHKGEVWVVSGDYKTDPDPLTTSFEPIKCHTFITECTFGLPIYNWPEEEKVIRDIEVWWKENQKLGKVSLISAYALGKAQRILASIDHSIGKVFTHGAVDVINQIHYKEGFLKPHSQYLSPDTEKEDLEGSLVIAPPSAIGSSWANRLKPLSVGIASGWMMLRGSKRRQNVDRGFILSDHADWKGLNEAVKATGAERVICTHGYTDSFSQWLQHNGYDAYPEETFFEGESLNAEPKEQ